MSSAVAFFPVEEISRPRPWSPAPRGFDAEVTDLRGVPLDRIRRSASRDLRRVIPPAESDRVPVAAFNACI
jgi:hypothetical protein